MADLHDILKTHVENGSMPGAVGLAAGATGSTWRSPAR